MHDNDDHMETNYRKDRLNRFRLWSDDRDYPTIETIIWKPGFSFFQVKKSKGSPVYFRA